MMPDALGGSNKTSPLEDRLSPDAFKGTGSSHCSIDEEHISGNSYPSTLNTPVDIQYPKDVLCGLWSWRPAYLQRFCSIYLFLGVMCFASIVQTALSVGLVSSQVTTLEKQFGLQSYHTGLTQAFFEVGYVCAVLFVSYYGGRGCMPRWISTGLVVYGFGALTFSLPQFIVSSLVDPELHFDYNCRPSDSVSMDVERCNGKYLHHASAKDNWYVIVFFVFGQIMMGIGASPILSLAPTYIDDHSSREKAPPMIAALHSAAVLGPLFGYALGSVCMRLSATFYQGTADPQADLDHMNARFIGAWWLGFLILGFLIMVSAGIISLFPKHLPFDKSASATNPDSRSLVDKPARSTSNLNRRLSATNVPRRPSLAQQLTHSNEACNLPSASSEYGKNIKKLPLHLFTLLRNRVFLLTSLGVCFECFLIVGFATFAPKYLEREYHYHPIMAAISSGLIVVPIGSFGILSGGILLYKFPAQRKRVAYLIVSSTLIVTASLSGFFFVGCENPAMVGFNVDHEGNRIQPRIMNDQVNFTQKCSSSCGCSANLWNPHCDPNLQISYFSPCFAGCYSQEKFLNGTSLQWNVDVISNSTLSTSIPKLNYMKCHCLAHLNSPNIHVQTTPLLVSGICEPQCGRKHAVFLFLLCVSLLFICLTQNPMVMITMRSVLHHERALALGLQLVIMRLCSSIPGPIVFGKMFDASCAHWKKDCSGGRGDCLISNVPQLSYNVSALCVTLEFGALLCFCLLLASLPKRDKSVDGNKDVAMEEEF